MDTLSNPFQDSLEWIDPRLRPDFQSRFYPSCDQAPPPDSEDPRDRIQLHFLSLYYDLNRCHAALLSFRQPGRENPEAQKRILQELEQYLAQRDALEDSLFPRGIMAEPELEEGFTRSLQFTFGDVAARLDHQKQRGFSTVGVIVFPEDSP